MLKKRNTIKQYEYTGGTITGDELRRLGLEGWMMVYYNPSIGSGILCREKPNKKLKLQVI